MIYRIRYQEEDCPGGAEAMIEANSPTEALVKFRHIRQCCASSVDTCEHITSVCVEHEGEGVCW